MVFNAARYDLKLGLLGFWMSQEKYPLLYQAAKEDPKLLLRMFEPVYKCWANGCFEESLEGIEQDLSEGKRDNFRNVMLSRAYWNKLLEDEDFRLYVEDEDPWRLKHRDE